MKNTRLIAVAIVAFALALPGAAEAKLVRAKGSGVHRARPSAMAVHGKRPTAKRPRVGKAPPAGTIDRSATAAPSKPAEEAKVQASPAAAKEASAVIAPRGPTRIDFDDRLVQGQMNKSGAVYLFDRKESALRSMVHRRTSFRGEIVKDVLD